MKRLISLFLALVLLLSSLTVLTACNEEPDVEDEDDTDVPEQEEDTTLDLTSEFVVSYDSSSFRTQALAKSFADTYKKKYGITLTEKKFVSTPPEYEIAIGSFKSREDFKTLSETASQLITGGISVGIVRVKDGRLFIYGNTDDALEVAVGRALALLNDKGDIALDTDETVIFNALDYKTDKTLTGYTLTDLKELSSASSITVGGKALPGFKPNATTYTVDASFKDGYPTVAVTPLWKDSVVSVTPATEKNGGVATVRITSASGNGVSVYTINVNMNNYYELGAEIVNKNGADGAVSFVIDDGVWATTLIADELMTKYNAIRLSFAVKTKDFATFTTNSQGTAYVMNGSKYTYTQTNAQKTAVNNWKGIIDNGRCELVSHTHTHAFHGTNDDGGSFEYVKNNETTVTTSGSFPKGSSTIEILGAKQVLEELFGIEAVTLIHAGIGVRTANYKLSSGKVIPTYKTFFNQVLTSAIDSGKIIGSRGTFGPATESVLPSKVNTPKIVEERKVSGIFAYMVRPDDDTNLWTKYIDEAVKSGGLAAFCIHKIVEDANTADHNGHYILKSQADKLFKHAQNLGKTLANMTFTEATKYYREWNSAKVTATAYKDESIKITLTDGLDNKLFNEALTVKVTVPDNWTSAKLGTNALTVHTGEGGAKYVLVNIVPDSGEVTVSKG